MQYLLSSLAKGWNNCYWQSYSKPDGTVAYENIFMLVLNFLTISWIPNNLRKKEGEKVVQVWQYL